MKNEDSERTCIVPGCGRTLPSDVRSPICEWHKGKIEDGAKRVLVGVAGVASVASFAVVTLSKVRRRL